MSSDWQNKRARDAYLASIPPGLRQQMENDAKAGRPVPAQFAAARVSEATVTGSFMAMPRAMYQGSVPGTEDGGYEMETTPGGSDGHTHTAYVDGWGNGHTSMDGERPHSHTIVSGEVDRHQDPSGMLSHTHMGSMMPTDAATYDPTPPYTGEV